MDPRFTPGTVTCKPWDPGFAHGHLGALYLNSHALDQAWHSPRMSETDSASYLNVYWKALATGVPLEWDNGRDSGHGRRRHGTAETLATAGGATAGKIERKTENRVQVERVLCASGVLSLKHAFSEATETRRSG